jgi:threonine dehydrogenase-like Zn-dependent dehydrogenase
VRQARWSEKGLELADVEPPELSADWVRLRVEACGICGTDLHLYHRTLPPMPGGVPGHEIVGSVLDGPSGLGDGLHAVEPLVWCGSCAMCQAGRRNLCVRGGVIGLVRNGGLADFVDVPRASLHAVAPAVPVRVASFAEPLAVCVRAVHLAQLETSSRVLVLGGGSIGLAAGLLARDRASEVAVTARHPHQAEAARRIGLVPLGEEAVDAWAADREPDVVIETVGGRADTVDDAVRHAGRGGRIVVLGVFSEPRPLSLFTLMLKELCVVGSNTYGQDRRGHEFAAAVDLLGRYQGEIETLQTHAFPLDRIQDAFACAADKRGGAIKVTVTP